MNNYEKSCHKFFGRIFFLFSIKPLDFFTEICYNVYVEIISTGGIYSMETLAVKYRPKTFEDMVEQSVVKDILMNQIKEKKIRNGYLFSGSAGCGKTSSARCFAKSLNCSITELDAASHSSVEDVRDLIKDSRLKPMGTNYRAFIIDEAHSLSNQAWQALLKTLEEPTPTSIFIFATTDPQKIPNTILSRIQRYNFKRISHSGVVNRLKYILDNENKEGCNYTYEVDALDYIAKLSEGGMRDAITLMEKSLGYSDNLTMETVTKALGTVDYDQMFSLTDALYNMNKKSVIEHIETIHRDGMDLKQFIKNYSYFVLDLCKYDVFRSFEYLQLPNVYEKKLKTYNADQYKFFADLLDTVMKLNTDIKWESTPKPLIESSFVLLCSEG